MQTPQAGNHGWKAYEIFKMMQATRLLKWRSVHFVTPSTKMEWESV